MTTEDKILVALQEIARWTRFIGLKAMRDVGATILKDDADKAIYHFSNGASTREIEKLVADVSRTTIAKKWVDWQALGLMHDSTRFQGRKEASFTLGELGIDLPVSVRKTKAPEGEASGSEDTDGAASITTPRTVEEFAGEPNPPPVLPPDSI